MEYEGPNRLSEDSLTEDYRLKLRAMETRILRFLDAQRGVVHEVSVIASNFLQDRADFEFYFQAVNFLRDRNQVAFLNDHFGPGRNAMTINPRGTAELQRRTAAGS